MTAREIEKKIKETRRLMEVVVEDLDFLRATQYRDEIVRLNELLKQ